MRRMYGKSNRGLVVGVSFGVFSAYHPDALLLGPLLVLFWACDVVVKRIFPKYVRMESSLDFLIGEVSAIREHVRPRPPGEP